MDADEALVLIETALEQHQLSKIEGIVFRGVWQGLSYAQIAKQAGYDDGYVKFVSYKLWKFLTEALGEKVTKSNLQTVLKHYLQEKQIVISQPTLFVEETARQDWGEVVDVSIFYGRSDELATLEEWVVDDRCRLVAIQGMGGIGKTALSVKLAKQVQGKFEYVIWRSLGNAKPLQEQLIGIIQFLSDQQELDLIDDIVDPISRLLEYLQQNRCLIVLDNFESVLQGGEHSGSYRNGYEGYGELLRRVGEVSHQSCLIVTSRERTEEIATLEGDMLPVRVLQLSGLEPLAGRQILKAKGLIGSEEETHQLVQCYLGNPLALKIAATSIKGLFAGNIREFLNHETTIFNGIRNLLDQQFHRLSPLEKQVMFWLCINRKPVLPSALKADILFPTDMQRLLVAVESLRRRSLIEHGIYGFTLQPVVMEYITDQFIEQFYLEITQEGETEESSVLASLKSKLRKQLFFLRHYALIKATAKDYVRESQIRVILAPLMAKLVATFNSRRDLADYLYQLLLDLRSRKLLLEQTQQQHDTGYGSGNIINLLCYLQSDLTGTDFSYLTIRQAYLQDVSLHRVNLSHCELIDCVFAETLGGVMSVAFSADGQLLAIGDTKGEIHLWQVRDSKPLLVLKEHTAWVVTVTFNPKFNILASCSIDQTIKLWDIQTGECLKTLQEHIGPVMSVAFSPDGLTLASGSADRTVKLWSVATGECLRTLQGHTDIVGSVTFSPDGQMLASSSDDKTVRLWNLKTGQCCKTFQEHTEIVWSVAFSPDGRTLASSSDDRTVKLWDIERGDCFNTLRGHTHTVFSIGFSPSGKTLVSGSGDQTLRIWDVQTGECLKTLQGHKHWVRSVAFAPDSRIIASSSGDQTVRLWEAETGQCIKTFQGYVSKAWLAEDSSDAQNRVNAEDDQVLQLWEVSTGRYFRILQGYTNAVWSVAFKPESKDGGSRLLASGGDDSVVRLWNIDTGECIKTFEDHSSRVWANVFSADGRFLASSSEDCTIKLWDAQSGQCLVTIHEHPHLARTLAFSPDSRVLASGNTHNIVKLYHVSTGECFKMLRGHTNWVLSIAFSSKGTTLVSGSRDQTIRLWDIEAGETRIVLQGHTGIVSSVAFSPDDRTIASGSSDRTVRLWDVQTGQCSRILESRASAVHAVVFNPDGQTFASGGEDGTIELWDVETGASIKKLLGHTSKVLSVFFDSDGQTLASGSRDETVKLWDVKQGKCIRTLREARLYEGMDITGIKGLTAAQKAKLQALGAVDASE